MSAVGIHAAGIDAPGFGFAPARRAAVAQPVRSHLRLTARGRAVLTTLAALPLVIAAVLMVFNGGGAVATSEKPVAGVEYEYVMVGAGDSLWSVAEAVAPTTDPRDFIADVMAFNGLASSELFVGQRLALPSKYSD